MENAADALKMAFAIFVFILALMLSLAKPEFNMILFSSLRE